MSCNTFVESFFACPTQNSKNPTRKFGISASEFCSFSSLAYFSLSLFEFFLKRYFGDQKKTSEFSGPYSEIRRAKWTNHDARSTREL